MTSPVAQSYDLVPYGSHAHPNTHPERLALLPHLYGLDAAPAQSCSYLELGCASGGNLIPLAASYPNAHFVGIDISERQISFGQTIVRDLGLKNIQLVAGDFAKVAAGYGKFDYIVAHGIFSWVSHEVQEAIFQILSAQLTDRGLGYISFNVLPGWYVRISVRDLILYHGRNESDPLRKISEGRKALRFVANCLKLRPTPDKTAVAIELETAMQMADWSIQHDYLSIDNQAFYISDVLNRASSHDLHYFGDTELVMNLPQEFPQTVQQFIRSQPIIEAEQYLDFARNRMFRRTLLGKMPPDRNIRAQRLESLYFRSQLQEQPSGAFIHPNGGGLPTPSPTAAKALRALQLTYPGEISMSQLIDTSGGDRAELIRNLTLLLMAGLLEATRVPFPCSYYVDGPPKGSTLAQYQLQFGRAVVNLRHEGVNLTEDEARLLKELDGRKTVANLQAILGGKFSEALSGLFNKGLVAVNGI